MAALRDRDPGGTSTGGLPAPCLALFSGKARSVSYVGLAARVRRDHPLRAIRHFADAARSQLAEANANGAGVRSTGTRSLLRSERRETPRYRQHRRSGWKARVEGASATLGVLGSKEKVGWR